MRITYTRLLRTSLAAAAVLVASTPASAQLDPLLFLKTTQPNIILAVDTSQRMQRDAAEAYYDPGTYLETGAAYESTIGLSPAEAAKVYRRKYANLLHLPSGGDKFTTTTITTAGDLEAGYATFYERTRLAIARRALIRALLDNGISGRFGLARVRQTNPLLPGAGNESPVTVFDLGQQTPTDHSLGKWRITRTTVGADNSATATSGLVYGAGTPGANTNILTLLQRNVFDAGALLPAGNDGFGVIDSPIGYLMDDARAHASSLITADIAAAGCRNTVVVMVVGGGEGTIAPQDLAAKASTFLNVSGRRVPIYVIAIAPLAGDVAALRTVAANSGGQFFEITAAMINAVTAGQPVPEAVRGINLAIQHSFVSSTTFNTAPTPTLPIGPLGEFQVTSPIVGSVNLKGASRFNPTTGALEMLPNSETEVFHTSTGAEIPQRSNVMVTSAFALPGFEGRLRALRIFRPVPDTAQPSGYRFTQDGSRLWTAAPPADPNERNIYTVLPGSSTMVEFDLANVGTLTPYLAVSDPSQLITWVRQQPLGAIVGSTPAFMDPPSLDPPPDDEYPAFREDNKNRRSLIFYGGNDGMMHAIDARTGLEVWAFVPFNLLPKLRALRSGQSLDAFNFFVDSSPKISDVKVAGAWKTYLFFGQGPGGTFYNALDITLPSINDSIAEDSNSTGALISYFSDGSRIPWKWSYPRLSTFSTAVAPYGDVSSANGATAQELSVGETWSDPAIGQIADSNGPYVMLTGSGFMKRSVETRPTRGGIRAGTTFYILDVATGVLHDSHDVGSDGQGETDDNCLLAGDCRRIKNALQMDPVATGAASSRFINKVYVGDLDGKVWRFTIGVSGTTGDLSAPTALYNATAAHPLFTSMATVSVGSTQQYIFVGTGSDLLPSTAVNQSYSLLVLLDNGGSASRTAEILLERTDLLVGDEKVSAFPAVAGDIVFFSTTTYNPQTPCTPFNANLYAFTFIGGPAYDTNNDGFLSTGGSGGGGRGGGGGGGTAPADSTKVFATAGARATAPFISDQHLVFAVGDKVEMFGDPNDFNNGVGQAGVRILSWRMIR
jgi:hypothetical protein